MKSLKIYFLFSSIILSVHSIAAQAIKPQPAIISGHIESAASDSLTLYVWQDMLSIVKRYIKPYKVYKSEIKNGNFYFKTLPLRGRVYISLSYGKNTSGFPKTYLEYYILTPGDNIYIQGYRRKGTWLKTDFDSTCFDCSSFTFKGKGSEKFKCLWALDERQRINNEKMEKMPYRGKSPFLTKKIETTYRDMQVLQKGKMEILAKYKGSISPAIWQIIKVDAIAKDHYYFYDSSVKIGTGVGQLSNDTLQLLSEFNKRKTEEWRRFSSFPESILLQSAWYSFANVRRAAYMQTLLEPKSSRYELVKKLNTGLLRQQLLTKYLYEETKIKSYDSLLTDAIQLVSLKNYNSTLLDLKNRLFRGSKAYNFALPDTSGKIVRLSDFKGKVVFIDFYFSGCIGCLDYFHRSVSKAEEAFKDNKDVVFITISIDRRDVWLKGLTSGDYTSERAINLFTDGQGGFHPVIRNFFVSSYPNPLLISKNGTVISNDIIYLGRTNPQQLIKVLNEALIK